LVEQYNIRFVHPGQQCAALRDVGAHCAFNVSDIRPAVMTVVMSRMTDVTDHHGHAIGRFFQSLAPAIIIKALCVIYDDEQSSSTLVDNCLIE